MVSYVGWADLVQGRQQDPTHPLGLLSVAEMDRLTLFLGHLGEHDLQTIFWRRGAVTQAEMTRLM